MARRRKESEFEAWVRLLSKLPWQWLVLSAVPAYFGFAALADWPAPQPVRMDELGVAIGGQWIRVIGSLFQYIAPATLLTAALISLVGNWWRQRLLTRTLDRASSQSVLDLHWRDFERLMHAWFEREGYRVSPTNSGPDGGVDLVLRREGETFLVQCKRWRATSIGVSVVRELYGVMASRGATGGFVVGVGAFTDAARQFAAGQNITLIDARAMVDESAPETAEELAPPPGATAPNCPSCGAHMKRRTAKRGPKRGQEFYGCSRFPQCRQTRDG
ncbi:restriction endonuclease [Salinisphaera sp. P385]|uniref:Restriction endonuclease n=1 Tax=Spectribacter acetivorans TaxID=3075603 RepID=A0ABU3BAK3_9GAMM|nr:restriction endonuclease [Salinisphaera sp. P385]MDT0618298.1 restriction endonuclease [Salinisphaera sp. P385]